MFAAPCLLGNVATSVQQFTGMNIIMYYAAHFKVTGFTTGTANNRHAGGRTDDLRDVSYRRLYGR